MPPTLLPVTAKPRERKLTYPLANSSRKKPRRWPLVLRIHKGSVHSTIILPIITHSILTAVVVYINNYISDDVSLPASIIPSLSIVVGLMLVFRNQTAFSRFWDGRQHLNTITTAVRCITRSIIVLAPPPPPSEHDLTLSHPNTLTPGLQDPVRQRNGQGPAKLPHSESTLFNSQEFYDVKLDEIEDDAAHTSQALKILTAMLYTVKNHLRANWGVALSPGTSITDDGQATTSPEYKELLPRRLRGYEHQGLGLTLELAVFVEQYIGRGVKKGWFHNAAASQMLSELNSITAAYGKMEVIRLVPIPVAHLIHTRQTLGLFCTILPFAMVTEMGWWAVPLVAFVAFTLYGIEGIATTLEDPFGLDKIDINMDDIVEDARREVEVLIDVWEAQARETASELVSSKQQQQSQHERTSSGGASGLHAHRPAAMFISRNSSFVSLNDAHPNASFNAGTSLRSSRSMRERERQPLSNKSRRAFSITTDNSDEDDDDRSVGESTAFFSPGEGQQSVQQVRWAVSRTHSDVSPTRATTPRIVRSDGDDYGTFGSTDGETTPRADH